MKHDKSEEVLVVLRKIIRAISLQSKQIQQTFGITTPQLFVLRALKEFGSITVGGISKEVNLSQATVTAIIDRLEKKNYVKRERSSSDRRKVYVNLTDLGIATINNAPSPLQEQFTESFSNLKEWEQTLILSSLQRVADMMGALKLHASPLLTEDAQISEN